MYNYTKEDIFNLRDLKISLPESIILKIENIRKSIKPIQQNTTFIEKKNYKFRSNLIQPDKEHFKMEINSILNKISNNNTDIVVNNLNQLQEKYDILNGFSIITEAIFDSSLKHTHFCKNYVHILVFIKDERILEEKKQIYNKFIFENNDKNLKLGFTHFLAHLFNFELLSQDFIKYTLIDILKQIEINKDYIEIIYIFHSKIDNKIFINNIIEKSICILIDSKNIPSKLKFKLMDIKDTF